MTDAERQANLDNISPEDLAKIQAAKAKTIKIEIEDLLEAEFALKFGWEAYRDHEADRISTKRMMKLLVASRKLDSLQQYRNAQAVLVGAGSAKSENPSKTFAAMTSELLRSAEADE